MLASLKAVSQSNLQFVVETSEKVKLGSEQDPESGVINIKKLRFYITNLKLVFPRSEYVYLDKQAHLVDAMDTTSMKISLESNREKGEKAILTFDIGVDSSLNEKGASGDDLDPMHGMYWSWQSGYINFKIEGIAKNCPARKNQFIFHVGGYAHPYNTLQEVRLPIEYTEQILLKIDLPKLFETIDLSTQYKLMRPGAEALQLSQSFSNIFSIVP